MTLQLCWLTLEKSPCEFTETFAAMSKSVVGNFSLIDRYVWLETQQPGAKADPPSAL